MRDLDLDRLQQLSERLVIVFYVLLFLAFLTAVLGSAGTGFLLLVLGGAAHAGRAGIEEFLASRRAGEGDAVPDSLEQAIRISRATRSRPRRAASR
jgi:hypothetical protein